MTQPVRRRLDGTDLHVYPLCLGGNVFGWTADAPTSESVLDAYVAAGGNFIDTADYYPAWVPGNVRDPSGRSGTHVGDQLELRLRWDALPGNLRLEAGMAHLFEGGFLERAPNATRQGDVNYGYLEATWWV